MQTTPAADLIDACSRQVVADQEHRWPVPETSHHREHPCERRAREVDAAELPRKRHFAQVPGDPVQQPGPAVAAAQRRVVDRRVDAVLAQVVLPEQ
jgi:hypothetical protein